jgi:pimeloyl-ACP methyl ester carboxylesterase
MPTTLPFALRTCRRATISAVLAGLAAAPLAAQAAPPAVTVAGRGPATYVLVSGVVGGVAGYRRLEARLLERGHRVVVVDPYQLSLDSADVSFAALARRVEAVLAAHDVSGATVVGHAHGAGVALRLAANSPERVTALYFLDVGALASHRSPILGSTLRLVPLIARLPGGRSFLRRRFVRGLRESAGRQEWLDAATRHAYVEPVLSDIGRIVRMVIRLNRAAEPDSLPALVARLRVPVTVVLGDAPHTAGPEPPELAALVPLGPLLRIERMPGVGHFPHEEAPDEVARMLVASRGAGLARHVGGAP